MAVLGLVAPCRSEAKGPPLPLLGVEGYTGVFATYMAYLANPAQKANELSAPSLEGIFVHMGHGRTMKAVALSEVYGKRLELGFAWDNFDMGDLPGIIEAMLPVKLSHTAVNMLNFNARYMLVTEKDHRPAVTLGMHYKHNQDLGDLNHDLGGAFTAMGITSYDGFDQTLYATKTLKGTHRPVMLSLGLRSTKAAHLGLLGFTDDRRILLEGNVVTMPTDKLVLAAEYRQKPNDYKDTALIKPENDWWTLCACFIANKQLTIGGGYGHFGDVLNHEANGSWGMKVKYEF